MIFDFPTAPFEGQEYTPDGGPTYVWNTPRWLVKGVPLTAYPGTKQQFNDALTDGDFVFVGDTIPATSLSGTKAQFDAALTDGDFAYAGHTHPENSNPTTKAQFNAALVDGDFAFIGHLHPISDISGTKAQFDASLSDGDFSFAGHTHSATAISGTMLEFNNACTDGDFSYVGHTHPASSMTGTMAQFDTAVTDGNFVYQLQNATLNRLDLNAYAVAHNNGLVSSSAADTLVLCAGTTFTTDGASIAMRGQYAGYNNHGMEFHAGGGEKMRIQADGKVGVNNAAPVSRLHVKGPDGEFQFGISGVSKGARFIVDSAGTTIQGVDYTLTQTYQPLTFGGSVVNFQSGGVYRGSFNADGTFTTASNVNIGGDTAWINSRLLLQASVNDSFVRSYTGTLYLGYNGVNSVLINGTGLSVLQGTGVFMGDINQMLLKHPSGSNPTLIHRNDGSTYYLLISDPSTGINGQWNALRPFMINMSNGVVSMNQGLVVSGTVSATTFSGGGSGLTGTAASLTAGYATNAGYANSAGSATNATNATNANNLGNGSFFGNMTWNNGVNWYCTSGTGQIFANSGTFRIADTSRGGGNYFMECSSGADLWFGYGGGSPNLNANFHGNISAANGGTISTTGEIRCGNGVTSGWWRNEGTTGLYNNSYGRGWVVPDGNGSSYGQMTVYGSGLNGWSGICLRADNRSHLMTDGGTIGLYDATQPRWLWQVDYAGNFNASGNVAAYSDLRLKNNVREIDNVTARRDTLALASIKYERDGRTRIGYGAQTLRDNGCSEFVFEADDAMKLATGLGTLSVDYGETTAILAAASKMTDDRVASLEARIAELEEIIRRLT